MRITTANGLGVVLATEAVSERAESHRRAKPLPSNTRATHQRVTM
jgi:hypothetical protein